MPTKKNTPRFTLKNTGRNSEHFGNCEVCHQPSSSIHTLRRERFYRHTIDGIKHSGWAYESLTFGCEPCLIKLRDQATP